MDDPEPDGIYQYKADIDSFTKDDAGTWRWQGGGGSDWRFGWELRRLDDRLAAGGPEEIFVAPGVAGAGVSAILLKGDSWSMECAIEPRTGAFLLGAGIYEEIEITAMDTLRRPLRSIGTTLWDAKGNQRQ